MLCSPSFLLLFTLPIISSYVFYFLFKFSFLQLTNQRISVVSNSSFIINICLTILFSLLRDTLAIPSYSVLYFFFNLPFLQFTTNFVFVLSNFFILLLIFVLHHPFFISRYSSYSLLLLQVFVSLACHQNVTSTAKHFVLSLPFFNLLPFSCFSLTLPDVVSSLLPDSSIPINLKITTI